MNRYDLVKAGIDVNAALNRFGNDVDTYEQILSEFLKDPHYQEMTDAIKAGDCPSAFSAAHALRDIAGNLSLIDLYDALNPLVEALRKGCLEDAEQAFEPVPALYHKLVEAIQNQPKKVRNAWMNG
jgi:HPt (histidine-containing phosphotransfer) domain-containing protein